VSAAGGTERGRAALTESEARSTCPDKNRPDLSLSNRPARVRAKPPRSSFVGFAKRPANDASTLFSGEQERYQGLRLDEMIREIVRSEVRAEVERVIAIGPAQPTHVSVTEYAAARSISVSTVRNAIRAGRLPAIRIGTAVRVPAEAEIGRPVIATAEGRDANPVTRAETILAERIARSLVKPNGQRVA
jgi:excisionase family DNA binding protein